MKYFIIALLVIAVALVLYQTLGASSSSSSSSTEPQQDTKVENDLLSLKDRIKNVENYGMRERYESPGNAGITIAGTFLECVIDITVALLRQSNIKKAALAFAKDENDGKIIAKMMRQITDEVVQVCEGTNFLTCQKCEDKREKCKFVGDESSMDVNQDDCDRYMIHQENIQKAVKTLLDKNVVTNALSDEAVQAMINIAVYNAEKSGVKVTEEQKSDAAEQIKGGWSSIRGKMLNEFQ